MGRRRSRIDLSVPHRPGWGQPLNQSEIAEMFGVSRSRIQQIIDKALRRLHRNPEAKCLAREMGILKGADDE